MAMICPVCSKHFEQRLQCPSCEVPVRPHTKPQADAKDPLPGHWSRNAWGRTLVGVLVAQGLFWGLRNLLLAGLVAASEESGQALIDLYGFLLLQVLQIGA